MYCLFFDICCAFKNSFPSFLIHLDVLVFSCLHLSNIICIYRVIDLSNFVN
jgi:hypothetical protein